MQTLSREEADKKWDLYWNELEHDWFKVEVLQHYGEDDSESLREFLKGNVEKSVKILEGMPGWRDEKGFIPKTRIHIVDLPLSPYLRWEIKAYQTINVPKVGEKVFLIDRKDVSNLLIPDGDFMIFDGKRVAKNTYYKNGVMKEVTFYEDEDISEFLHLKNALIKRALPLEEFVKKHSL